MKLMDSSFAPRLVEHNFSFLVPWVPVVRGWKKLHSETKHKSFIIFFIIGAAYYHMLLFQIPIALRFGTYLLN